MLSIVTVNIEQKRQKDRKKRITVYLFYLVLKLIMLRKKCGIVLPLDIDSAFSLSFLSVLIVSVEEKGKRIKRK